MKGVFMKKIMITIAVVGGIFSMACASSGGKHFGKIYPGMTTEQAVATMDGKGPSQVQSYDKGYSAWYYGKDQCLLIQEEKVVSKSTSEKNTTLDALTFGGYSSKKLAQCVPPGQEGKAKIERKVETPFGDIKH
jgi:hypothetical protein